MIDRRRRWVWMCLALALLLTTAACGPDEAGDGGGENGGGESQQAGGDTLLIGHAAAYSGQESYLGPAMLTGIELAVSQVNEAGGVLGNDVEFETADTEGRPETGVSAVSHLLDVQEVNALIGPTSLEIFSVIDRIRESGTPDIVIGSTSRLDTAMGGETMWRLIPSDTLMGPAMGAVALNRGFDEAAALFEDQESAQSVKASVVPTYEAQGGTIVTEVDPALAQANYRSEVQALLKEDVPFFFTQISPEVGSVFWKNALEFGGDIEGKTVMGTDVFLSEDTLKSFGPAIDALELLAVSPAAEGPAYEDFVTAYEDFHGKSEPEVFAAHTWDAVNLISLAAISAGSVDRDAIAGAMREVGEAPGTECQAFVECRDLLEDGEDIDYQGASSGIDWDDNGNVIAGFGIFEYQDGKMVQTDSLPEEEVAAIVEDLDV